MTWEQWLKYDIRALLWIMDARNERIEKLLRSAQPMIQEIVAKEETVMLTAQDILNKIAEVKDRADAENELLDHIHQMLIDALNTGNPALMQQAIDQLDAIKQGAVDAITRNTVDEGAPNNPGPRLPAA